jgi:hypothetical protein
MGGMDYRLKLPCKPALRRCQYKFPAQMEAAGQPLFTVECVIALVSYVFPTFFLRIKERRANVLAWYYTLIRLGLTMQEALKLILDIQELDMQMIRLMRLKRERQKEVNNIASIKKDLQRKVLLKENEILELKKTIRLDEGEVQLVIENIKKLESQQGSIRKVEEFNALTHEISTAERDRVAKEARLSDFMISFTPKKSIIRPSKVV